MQIEPDIEARLTGGKSSTGTSQNALGSHLGTMSAYSSDSQFWPKEYGHGTFTVPSCITRKAMMQSLSNDWCQEAIQATLDLGDPFFHGTGRPDA
jgi:hypothetical protein